MRCFITRAERRDECMEKIVDLQFVLEYLKREGIEIENTNKLALSMMKLFTVATCKRFSERRAHIGTLKLLLQSKDEAEIKENEFYRSKVIRFAA